MGGYSSAAMDENTRQSETGSIDDAARNRARGCLVGLAVGDAIGTTVEFSRRGSFDRVTDMVGGGPFGLRPGEWTDDTSMALCLAASLLQCRGFDPKDQMDRYLLWRDEGYQSVNGACFDIGNTVSAALRRFEADGEPFAGSTDPRSAGNGSIMRLAPVAIAHHRNESLVAECAGASSRTTHGAEECVDACRMLGVVLARLIAGGGRGVITSLDPADIRSETLRAIAEGKYAGKPEAEIRSSGYVVHTLEAALWCFDRESTFEGAVLAAANLGDDADTVAAVCGQIAGAFHGLSGIPERWRERVAWKSELETTADRLFAMNPTDGLDASDGRES